MPAPKVHRESKEKKNFARRASCPRLRFTRKARKIVFCATRLVPTPKVYRKALKKKILRYAPVPAPKVHRESNEKNVLRYAPRARALGSQ